MSETGHEFNPEEESLTVLSVKERKQAMLRDWKMEWDLISSLSNDEVRELYLNTDTDSRVGALNDSVTENVVSRRLMDHIRSRISNEFIKMINVDDGIGPYDDRYAQKLAREEYHPPTQSELAYPIEIWPIWLRSILRTWVANVKVSPNNNFGAVIEEKSALEFALLNATKYQNMPKDDQKIADFLIEQAFLYAHYLAQRLRDEIPDGEKLLRPSAAEGDTLLRPVEQHEAARPDELLRPVEDEEDQNQK